MKTFYELVISLVIAITLTYFSYALGMYMGWITSVSYVEVIGVVLNYSCVWLTARQNIWCWPIGIAAVIALGVLFWQATLLASFTLSIAYFLPVQFIGWFVWNKGHDIWSWKQSNSGDTVPNTIRVDYPVTTLTKHQWILTALGVTVAAIIVFVVNSYFGGVTPFFDGLILVVSVIAQYLLNYKKIESWVGWLIVNIVSIYVYSTAGLFVLATQYALFLLNAAYGFYTWYNSPQFNK